MSTYVPVEEADINKIPAYMDPANSVRIKLHKQLSMTSGTSDEPRRCKHCGAFPGQVVVWPAPRPAEHIRQSNCKFIGYVLLIATVIFLLFAACKYLP